MRKGNIELVNAKKGNMQLDKVMFGNKVVWENKTVLLDAQKGIDKIQGKISIIYQYAKASFEKMPSNTYKFAYNSNSGQSACQFKIEIPSGYNGLIIRLKNISVWQGKINVNATFSGNQMYGTQIIDLERISANVDHTFHEPTGNAIGIGLASSWGSGKNYSSFEIEYLELLK